MAEVQKISFWQRLTTAFSRGGSEKRSATTFGQLPLPGAVNFGVVVSNELALKNTALYAGIRILSETLASLPRAVRMYKDGGTVDASSHPAYKLIAVRPNSYTNTYTFWAVIVTWIKGWGNAYALIERDEAGTPIALHQIHPSCVRITVVNGRKWYQVTQSGSDLVNHSGMYKDDDMLHFMEMSLNGITGVNPILYNAAALGKAIATEQFAADFFRHGGHIKAVMETEGSLGEEQYEAFMQHFGNAAQNFDTPLLEYGIKYKQLNVDPVAAQLVQSEILSIQDVCRIINIPPHLVAELSRSTFSNIEHQNIQFVQYSLRPIAKRLETELESKLFVGSEAGQYDVKFILDGLMRGDTAARSAYYHNAILDGYMSRNEVRELEGLHQVDGLDDMLYPLNTGIVGRESEKPID